MTLSNTTGAGKGDTSLAVGRIAEPYRPVLGKRPAPVVVVTEWLGRGG